MTDQFWTRIVWLNLSHAEILMGQNCYGAKMSTQQTVTIEKYMENTIKMTICHYMHGWSKY